MRLPIRSALLKRVNALLAITLVIGVFPSCNGNDETLSAAERAKIVKRANAICEANAAVFHAEIKSLLANPRSDVSRKGAIVSISQILAREFQVEADEFRTLEVPPEDREEFDAIIVSMQKVATDAKEHPERFLGYPASLKEAKRLNRRYGITACPTK